MNVLGSNLTVDQFKCGSYPLGALFEVDPDESLRALQIVRLGFARVQFCLESLLLLGSAAEALADLLELKLELGDEARLLADLRLHLTHLLQIVRSSRVTTTINNTLLQKPSQLHIFHPAVTRVHVQFQNLEATPQLFDGGVCVGCGAPLTSLRCAASRSFSSALSERWRLSGDLCHCNTSIISMLVLRG